MKLRSIPVLLAVLVLGALRLKAEGPYISLTVTEDVMVGGNLFLEGDFDMSGSTFSFGINSSYGPSVPGITTEFSIGNLPASYSNHGYARFRSMTSWAQDGAYWSWESPASQWSQAEPVMELIANNSGSTTLKIDGSNVLTTASADVTYIRREASSVAVGASSASGNYSTAFGTSHASDNYATAMGDSNASSYNATAMGYSIASGAYSTAMGCDSAASGYASTALGYANAVGHYSTAMGYSSHAFGAYSTAMGNSTAGGYASTSMGLGTSAQGAFQVVVGRYNIIQGDPLYWIPEDDLFTVGNGDDAGNPSNAFVVKKNGNAIFQGVVHVAPGGDIPMFQP